MNQSDNRFLMSDILGAWDWFDGGLQNILRSSGFPSLNKSQSMMVLYISAGIHRPIEIARKMRLSRQAIRHISNQLIDLGLVAVRDDPDDARSKILAFTGRSVDTRVFAQQTIFQLETILRARLGEKDLDTLKRILRRDWGKTVSSEDDLADAKASNKSRNATVRRSSKLRRANGLQGTGGRTKRQQIAR